MRQQLVCDTSVDSTGLQMTANSQIIPNRLHEITSVSPFVRQKDSRLTPSYSRFIDFLIDTSHFKDGY